MFANLPICFSLSYLVVVFEIQTTHLHLVALVAAGLDPGVFFIWIYTVLDWTRWGLRGVHGLGKTAVLRMSCLYIDSSGFFALGLGMERLYRVCIGSWGEGGDEDSGGSVVVGRNMNPLILL